MLFGKREDTSRLDGLIGRVELELDAIGPESEKYRELLSNLERLYKLRNEGKREQRVSPNTMAMVAGNILGILIMVGYEQKHVITSKSLGFIFRPRIED